MSETTVDIQNIFASIASRYDTLNTILSLNIDQLWRKKAIKLCDLKENKKVVDVSVANLVFPIVHLMLYRLIWKESSLLMRINV